MPADGRMTWAEAVAGPLAGATCLWQDLDGLHVAPAPDAPPYTSIMWGWRADSALVRLRLDGDVAFVAVHEPDGSAATTVPWADGDGRVAARRAAGSADNGAGAGYGVGATYEQVVVQGAGDAAGAITFVRPVARAGRDHGG